MYLLPTPVSRHGEPRAYSPVNVFAKIIDDPALFKKARDGDQVVVKKVDDKSDA